MGFPGILQYKHEKSGIDPDLGLPVIFHLLRSLAGNFRKPGLDRKSISDRRLELGSYDGSCYILVLVESEVG